MSNGAHVTVRAHPRMTVRLNVLATVPNSDTTVLDLDSIVDGQTVVWDEAQQKLVGANPGDPGQLDGGSF